MESWEMLGERRHRELARRTNLYAMFLQKELRMRKEQEY